MAGAMPRLLTATYRCGSCGEETDGIWPDPEQDEIEPARQQCPCGHSEVVAYPGYSFRTEAG